MTNEFEQLPPNPFIRQPVKKRGFLAGRNLEVKNIRYYFRLTAAGQNPHIALIGQRGVGKTSLLNEAEALAEELDLLVVRLDMNENKIKSVGRFWHDFYSALIIALGKKGCWGGEHGVIHGEIFEMMYRKQPKAIDRVVLRWPYAYSCYQGEIDTFECDDALIVRDFENIIEELTAKNLKGIVFLIDEADCLARNVPLLQMLRNIFQTVSRCSLALAGTQSVFPVLSEVFSPIPRQFHRISVEPFSNQFMTEMLIRKFLGEELLSVMPADNTLEDLHKLCGGDPAQIQLYCHHMYRMVEEKISKRMELTPYVFREVLREYRDNIPSGIDEVLNAIEQLPNKILFESKWLKRKNITLAENVKIEILKRELTENEVLSSHARDQVSKEMASTYKTLHELGIIELDNRLNFLGGAFTANYWKSYVKAEKKQDWAWNDDSFLEILKSVLTNSCSKYCETIGTMELMPDYDDLKLLQSMRAGEHIEAREFPKNSEGLFLAAFVAMRQKCTMAVDVNFLMKSSYGEKGFGWRFFENPAKELTRNLIEQWFELKGVVLEANDIFLQLAGYHRWLLPTPLEAQRASRILEFPWWENIFGPDEFAIAVEHFKKGEIPAAIQVFDQMLQDKDDASVRNNLAFCQVLTGKTESAYDNITKALQLRYEPLFEYNKAILEVLKNELIPAGKSFVNALARIDNSKEKRNLCDVLCVLLYDFQNKKVFSEENLPLDAAILLMLCGLKHFDRAELFSQLNTRYLEKSQAWMDLPDKMNA